MIQENQKTVKKVRGFSFGETLLAAFVLSVGLLSIVKLFQVSLSQSLFLRDATIASQLAQEGVELVRNVRDNNFVGGGTGFSSFSSSNKHCYIAVDSPTLNCFSTQSGTSRYNLIYQGGQYVSTTGASKFRRYVYVDYSSSSQEATVKSFVVWDGTALPPSTGSTAGCSIQNKCVYTEVFLTNWKS